MGAEEGAGGTSPSMHDPELQAMSAVAVAIEPLEPEARSRVVLWIADRCGVALAQRPAAGRQVGGRDGGGQGFDESEFVDFASFYHAASPENDNDRALVAGYWFQVLEGQQDIGAQQCNDSLKNMGHGVANITKAFTRLQDQKPALVMQVRKTGSSSQARKLYRLTDAGKRRVQELLAPGGDHQ